MNSLQVPATGPAEVRLLRDGYVGLDGGDERVSGTVTLIVDGYPAPDVTICHSSWAVGTWCPLERVM